MLAISPEGTNETFEKDNGGFRVIYNKELKYFIYTMPSVHKLCLD